MGAALIAGGLVPNQAFANGITSIAALLAGAPESAYALPTAGAVVQV